MAAVSFSRAKVFISYSHKDAKHLKRLQAHLADYERNKLVEIWDDTKITPGATWRDEIEEAMDSAKVAVLLVSADFLASEFVAESELPRLLTAAKKEGTIILPIILSPCGFEYTKLSQFQAVNSPSMPLTRMTYHQREDLWAKVAKVIRDTTSTHTSENLASNYQQSSPDLQTLTQRALYRGTETILQSSDVDVQGFLPNITHKRALETLFPGCFIFLLDQSASMAKPFGIAQTGVGKRICDIVANLLNAFLNELIVINTISNPDSGVQVKPRAEVIVLGYGDNEVYPLLSGALADKTFVTLPELQVNPLDIETRIRKEIDDIGNPFEIPVVFPIWVRPKFGGDAPMCAAFQRARELAEQWVAYHPTNHPPIVINITNGIASDGDPTKAALQLCQVSTADGQTLLFNVQISELRASPIVYPSSEAELPDDPYTKRLFSLSSIIPERSRILLEAIFVKPMPSGARGFIFDGDISSFRLMFQFDDIERTIYGGERLALDEAMLHSQISLKVQDPDLKEGKVEIVSFQTSRGSIQRPWGIEGGLAVVYKFRTLWTHT